MNTTATLNTEPVAKQSVDAQPATINEIASRQLLDAELFFVGGGVGEVILG